MASNRDSFFSASGHQGFVVTHGSIKATWPEGVVSENVLWPKYVMRLPFVLSMRNSGGDSYKTTYWVLIAQFGVSWNPGPEAFESLIHTRPAGLRRTYVRPACRLCRRRMWLAETHSNLEAPFV